MDLDKDYTFKVKDIRTHGILDTFTDPDTKRVTTYVIISNIMDVNGKLHKNVKFLIDPRLSEIDNLDLFRAIVYGYCEEIPKFKFIKLSER